MKIIQDKTPEQIISEQKSFTDKVHVALLITEHGDHPNGLGSSIELSKNQKLKKIIEEIYGALLDGGLKTNETLFEKINEIIKNKNFEGIEILGKNLFYAFQNLKDEKLEIERFSKTKKQSSKIKDPINDFLKVFNSSGGKSEHYSFIGFKKIQNSNQKRNENHSGSLKHSNPWLMKGLNQKFSDVQKKLSEEFDIHSFISKIWNSGENSNEISKIRHTYQSYGSTNLYEEKNKENLFILIKFFENSISLDSVDLNELLKNNKNLKLSDKSIDNLIFGLMFHNDLEKRNIIVQFNQDDSIDLKLIDFEMISQSNHKDIFKSLENLFDKDFQEKFFPPKKVFQSLQRVKKRIFKTPKELGLDSAEGKKLFQIQKNFNETVKNLNITTLSSKIITHLSLTMLALASAFACCFVLKKIDDHLTKTKLLITAGVSFIVSFVLIEIFSKLIDLEPKIDEFTDFVFEKIFGNKQER